MFLPQLLRPSPLLDLGLLGYGVTFCYWIKFESSLFSSDNAVFTGTILKVNMIIIIFYWKLLWIDCERDTGGETHPI